MGGIANLKGKGANMGFWTDVGEGILKWTDDNGQHKVTKVFGGQRLLDQTKDYFRTIDRRNIIRTYENTPQAKRIK